MKTGWVKSKLGEIYDVRDGTHDSPKYHAVGYPLITSKNLKPNGLSFDDVKLINDSDFEKINERSSVNKGDVLFAMIGTIGNPTLVDVEPNFAIKNVALFKIAENQSGPFLKYYLESDWVKSKMVAEANGTTQRFVGLGYLRNFPIELPPLPEQHRIVAILDEAFDGIATAKANAEKNLQTARALFESHLQAVFSQRSEGWEARRLGEVFDIGSSKRILETEWTGAGVPFYGGKEIVKLAKSGTVISNAYISEEKYQDYASKYDMPQQGDILITARGTIGVGYVVKEGDKFYYKDGNIISMRGKTPTNPHFILYAFRSNAIADQLGELNGTTVRHLPIEKAKELVLRMPGLVAQNTVVEQIREIESETQHLESIYQQKLAAFDELKKSLLHQAFSGQL